MEDERELVEIDSCLKESISPSILHSSCSWITIITVIMNYFSMYYTVDTYEHSLHHLVTIRLYMIRPQWLLGPHPCSSPCSARSSSVSHFSVASVANVSSGSGPLQLLLHLPGRILCQTFAYPYIVWHLVLTTLFFTYLPLGTLASLFFLKCIKHALAPRTLHWLLIFA